jgi:hypothetical protein
MKLNLDDTRKLQELLSYKRIDRPSDDYFKGVLGEFHRRQRSAILQPRVSPWQAWWADFMETFTLQPARVLRYGMGVACAISLSLFAINATFTSDKTTVVVQSTSPKTVFALSSNDKTEQSLDQKLDAATISAINYDPSAAQDHYVLNDQPANYDSALAF